MSDRTLPKRLNITRGVVDHHNYRLDSAHQGRYLRRLPDRSLVYADEYDEALAKLEAKQKTEAETASRADSPLSSS